MKPYPPSTSSAQALSNKRTRSRKLKASMICWSALEEIPMAHTLRTMLPFLVSVSVRTIFLALFAGITLVSLRLCFGYL